MLATPQATQRLAVTQARELVRDLHAPDMRIYWIDMLLSAGIGWSAFGAAVTLRPWSRPMLAALSISVFALYRGVCFLHEITHLRNKAFRRFEMVWNVVLGIPLLLPPFVYVGVHQYHHKLATYGTERDPEYLPFSGKPGMILRFTALSLLTPAALLARFLVLAPVGMIFAPVHRWLCAHASALCLNMRYRRETPEEARRAIRRGEVAALVAWAMAGALAVYVHMAWRCLAVWYTVMASIAVINTLRTLGAHRYASDGAPLDREEQLIDSIDTPGVFWTELWAPVGLRYHALHHYFPGIPYHNLKAARLRLIASLSADAGYHRVTSPGLSRSLSALCRGKY